MDAAMKKKTQLFELIERKKQTHKFDGWLALEPRSDPLAHRV